MLGDHYRSTMICNRRCTGKGSLRNHEELQLKGPDNAGINVLRNIAKFFISTSFPLNGSLKNGFTAHFTLSVALEKIKKTRKYKHIKIF